MTDTTIELIDKAEVRDGQALVAYNRTEAAIAELRAKYKDARYDLTTTAGDKAARAGRLALVTLRTDLEKKRKELKAPAIDFGKKIDSEAARLTAEILTLETPIDAQIKADEQRREEERRVKEEAEAARKKVHTDAIAKIAGYVGQAADLPAARIAAGIHFLNGIDLAGFEEFTEEATATRARTVGALEALLMKATAREAEEARLKVEREEQARVAAEQAETARKLKAQQDELDRQRAELQEREDAARRQREETEAAARRQEQEAAARVVQERRSQGGPIAAGAAIAQPEGQESFSPAPALTANVLPMQPRAAAAPAAVPTLRLGEIQRRIAPLSIDAAGLTALGFPVVKSEGAAKLWHEHQFPAICDALITSLTTARDQREAA